MTKLRNEKRNRDIIHRIPHKILDIEESYGLVDETHHLPFSLVKIIPVIKTGISLTIPRTEFIVSYCKTHLQYICSQLSVKNAAITI